MGGRGLAIATVPISVAWAAIIAVGVVLGLSLGVERNEAGELAEAADISIFELGTGDCVRDLPGGEETTSVQALPCDQRHVGEVVGSFEFPEATGPASTQCSPRPRTAS